MSFFDDLVVVSFKFMREFMQNLLDNVPSEI